ncbi:MAG TPA: AAA family ATPase [Actinomycetales bacterium]|nr:AAA family ATPase [Actinomycetales bacterium]
MKNSGQPSPWHPSWRPGALVLSLLLAGLTLLGAALGLRQLVAGDALAEVTPGVTLAQVVTDVQGHQVQAAAIDERYQTLSVAYSPTATGTAVPASARTGSGRSVTTVSFPRDYASELTATVLGADVPLTVLPADSAARAAATADAAASPWHVGTSPSPLLGLVIQVSGFGGAGCLLAGVLLWGRRRTRGALHVVDGDLPLTRFSDVAGAEEAVADLRELVEFLSDPDRFRRLGATVPKGALLCGPPGTGKTLLARAVAGEAGVPFFSASGSDFVEMYVGVGAKRVRELFAKAARAERAIVFIDEIDALARTRSSGESQASNIEQEGTLVALLTALDGFADRGSVIVLAATNRPDILDPALTRPGRLDRKIEVPNPDRRGREAILSVHGRGKPLHDDVDLTSIARRTPGFSGAQLSAVVNEAALEAVRRELDAVTAECFDHAVATIAMGRARTSAMVTEHDRRIAAWHEAGHTIAALLLPEADDPVQVTIVPRGPAGGVTWMAGNDDVFLGRRRALSQMIVSLAGRAGEEALLDGEYTQGAAGDLQSATQTALNLVTQYGMSRLGYMVRSDGVLQAGGMREVNEVVEELLGEAHAKATELVRAHRALLDAVAERLLDVETLTLAQVRGLADSVGAAVPARLSLVDSTPWRGERARHGGAGSDARTPTEGPPGRPQAPESWPPLPTQRGQRRVRQSDLTAAAVVPSTAATTLRRPAVVTAARSATHAAVLLLGGRRRGQRSSTS